MYTRGRFGRWSLSSLVCLSAWEYQVRCGYLKLHACEYLRFHYFYLGLTSLYIYLPFPGDGSRPIGLGGANNITFSGGNKGKWELDERENERARV